MKIKAAQHIYGNVEEKLSPNKVGGFQALFRTRSLITEEESEEIEERLVYFLSETNPVKWLFFTISSSKVVISRIVPLQDVDKFGRSGSYLAHSIMLTSGDFIKVKSNPFVILSSMKDRFISGVSEALEKGDSQSADIEEISLEISETDTAAAEKRAAAELSRWQTGELEKLAHYTINHGKLREKRIPLVFKGDEERILDALQAALIFVPESARAACCFDTHFHDCNITINYFWATGYPGASKAPPHLPRVDTVEKKITGDLSFPVLPYEEWLRDRISQNRFSDIMSFGSIAYELQKLIYGQSYDEGIIRGALSDLTGGSAESSAGDFFGQIARIYREPLHKRIKQELASAVGRHLAAHLQDKILNETHSQPSKLFEILLDGIDLRAQVEELYRIYKQYPASKPGREEIEELRSLLAKARHDYLSFLSTLWDGDLAAVSRYLDRLPGESCREMLGLCFRDSSLPLHKIIPAEKVEIFLETFIDYSQAGPVDIIEYIPLVVEKLIELRQGDKLVLFQPLLKQLTLSQLKAIKKVLKKVTGKQPGSIPHEFGAALESAYMKAQESSESKKGKGIFKSLLSTIFKSPRRGAR